MPSIESVICWITTHWKSLGLAAIAPAVAGVLMWVSTLRKNKAERLLAKANLRKLQREETQIRLDQLQSEQSKIDHDLTGPFCTSRREREFTRRTAGYANQEVQSRTDRDVTASN
jgi:hypothetical protein